MMTKPGELIHVRRAAEILCCTPKHIGTMVQDGRLSAVRLGPRGIRVIRSSVEIYIENNRVNPEDYFK